MQVAAREYPFIIAGAEVAPERLVAVRSPFSGDEVGMAGSATALEVERAIAAAAAARTKMAHLPAYRRQQALLELERALQAERDEFARLIALEAGKPLRDAYQEVQRGLLTLRTAAEEALRLPQESIPLDVTPGAEGRWAISQRFPLGLIAAVTPFNFPLNLVLHKLAPAIASGNCVIVKASPRTPLTALRLGQLCLRSDLPKGAVSVLSGGAETVQQLLQDERISMLSFTGSAAVGWKLRQQAGRKRVVLELGGNAANIIHHDAEMHHAVSRVVRGGFSYAGQSCISAQRILVHESVYEQVREQLVHAARGLRLGDPLDETTDVGPMIDEAAAIRCEEWIHEALEGGATLLAGGKRDGGFVTPTVLENVKREMKVCREEVFAPVLVLMRYREQEEAIEEANASRFGLQAGLFTHDLRFILKAYRGLEVGGLIVNDVSAYRLDPMPYGGVKESGIGREGIRSAMESMTEQRLLVLNG